MELPWITPIILLVLTVGGSCLPGRANIVFIMSDDQDRLLGSMQYMETLQHEMVAKGAEFTHHYATIAQCCPSRASLLRGQAAHNTNVTNVFGPGGNYEKFVMSGQVNDYLPFWLKRAGYRTEYIGKFLNGHNVLNYSPGPLGWDHIDTLVEPYQVLPNNVVMSENGNTPVAYQGYHQTDVIRAKALARLNHLTSQDDPFFLALTPTAPHAETVNWVSVPCQRHMELFPNVTAPRLPNYNPTDEIQQNNGGFLRDLPVMDAANISYTDYQFRKRVQSLVGIDEMLADVLSALQDKGVLENTYVIYTSDNGFHLGNHRMTAGKTTAFAEDSNLPFIVRGPGIPAGVKSNLPSAHLDLAPTFLDITGLAKRDYPPFLDGRSLLDQWQNPTMKYSGYGEGNVQEVLNVEYWGKGHLETKDGLTLPNNTYKSLRIVGSEFAYLYIHWCSSNQQELYNTLDDPYEINNIARSPDTETQRLVSRLNAMLLVTKSCSKDSCRNPWKVLLGGLSSTNPPSAKISTLKQAMDPAYDEFFASFPKVNIKACLSVQDAENEAPFLPREAGDLGRQYRLPTDSLGVSKQFKLLVKGNSELQGTLQQRHATLQEIMTKARKLTQVELDPDQTYTTISS